MSQELTELQQQIVRFYHHNPFVEYLHIQVQPLPTGEVRLELPIDEVHTNLYGIAHGECGWNCPLTRCIPICTALPMAACS